MTAPAPAPAARAEGLGDRLAGALEDLRHEEGRRAALAVSRTGVGIALVIAAGLVFLQATGALSAARDVLLSVFVAIVVLGVIFAPWIVKLARSLTSERAERIRSQERAEVAAHLHDSVLQTLAMVQRRAGDPQEVAAIARRQERELRAWLAGRPAPGAAARLAPALEAAATEVEERYGVPVEVVVVGDRDLDPSVEAVVAAAREAMTNAAKFGGGSTVDVYAESVRRPDPGVRPRPRPRLRPRAAAVRPARRPRIYRGPHGAPRRQGDDHELGRDRHRGRARPGGARMSEPRVLIVDDHQLFRAGVRSELDPLLEVVGEASGVAGGGARDPRARARGRAARRAHAGRRRRRGDPPHRRPRWSGRRPSSLCRCRMRPRT